MTKFCTVGPIPGVAKQVLGAWTVVKGCYLEIISMTFSDHNLDGQPGQLLLESYRVGPNNAVHM